MKEINISQVLKELQEQHFWGSVEIELRDGTPALLRKSETIKLDGAKGKNHAKETNA